MKNRIVKILLSVVIIYFIAHSPPLVGQDDECNTVSATVQEVIIADIEPQVYYIPIEHIEYLSEKSEIEIAYEEMNEKLDAINSNENRYEWFLAYKDIINEYSYIFDKPETIYDCFTEEELNLLFHVVQAEIGDEYSFEQKTNVASVIFNRLYHEEFPYTLLDILTSDQFASISDGRYKNVEISDVTIAACEYAFQIEDTTNGCLFFDSNSVLKYSFVFNDGAHNFYRLKDIE